MISLGSRRRRDRLFIMTKVVYIAGDGTLKTQIMYRGNLSFAQLNEYLKLVTDLNLVEKLELPGKTVYRQTEKGKLFLDVSRIQRDVLSNRGSEDPYLDKRLVEQYRAALAPLITSINERNKKKAPVVIEAEVEMPI